MGRRWSQDEGILRAHADDEVVAEFFGGRIWIVRWFDSSWRVKSDRYSLFVNGYAECIGAFSARDAVHLARRNRVFLQRRKRYCR